ncbi:unnamed protein product, partial [marine sediment metagenome]
DTMASKENLREKYFTKEGLSAIENRINTLVKFCNEGSFPIKKMMYGFNSCSFESREECLQSIKELCIIIGASVKIETRDDGKGIKEGVIY